MTLVELCRVGECDITAKRASALVRVVRPKKLNQTFLQTSTEKHCQG
jgi:hypothetical protein